MVDQTPTFLELSPPESGHTERIRFLAKALASGVEEGKWATRFKVAPLNPNPFAGATHTLKLLESWEAIGHPDYTKILKDYLRNKWHSQHPQATILEAYGYLERRGDGTVTIEYILTQKALALLDEPRFKKVFISYLRQESSAFALLLNDRLKQALFEPFIDLRSIEPGEQFQNRIDAEIDASEVFVCLVGTTTFGSPYVIAEIDRALARSMLAVPIWHNNFNYLPNTFSDAKDDFFSKTNAIVVDPENVNGYDNAYRELIQFLQRPEM